MFSPSLQEKINTLKAYGSPLQIGAVTFANPLILAPMSAISKAPFRLLMEDLGAGGTVSELISAAGTFYQNQQTTDMFAIDSREKNVGLQIFGDVTEQLVYGAIKAQEAGAKFVDLNMGCPVKKVVCKGAGSAMLKEPHLLAPVFKEIKRALSIPFTIKIRTGWQTPNAHEVIHVAKEEGIEFVSLHGRTREQQYRGLADWDYIETLAQESPLPLIGNGDLHSPQMTSQRWAKTSCSALMLGRGPLRNPFIFLETLQEYALQRGLISPQQKISFWPEDIWEVLFTFYEYLQLHESNSRKHLVQFRKMALWFSAGLPHSVKYRTQIFAEESVEGLLKQSEDYFQSLGKTKKDIDPHEPFMNGGHG